MTIRIDADAIINTTEPGMVLGTPAYMSPEQVRGEPADHRADIFAFGYVLYEMLSGTRAFRRDTPVASMNAVLSEEPPDLSATNANISLALERIVRRCLEKQPDNGFQSARDMAFAPAATPFVGPAFSNTLRNCSIDNRSTSAPPSADWLALDSNAHSHKRFLNIHCRCHRPPTICSAR
ncbi:MAG: protein kinase [Verrucomicrobiota bacterium]